MIAAFTLVLGLGTAGAFAAEVTEVELTKTLTNTGVGNNPALAFSFEVANGSAVSGGYTDSAGKAYDIRAGVTDGLKFDSGDDTVSYAAGEVAAGDYVDKTTNLTVDPSVFSEPGIYRYIVTETADSSPGVSYNTEEKTYYVDLYIVNSDSGDLTTPATLECASVVVMESEDPYESEAGDPETISDKTDLAFANEYKDYTVTVSKKITGNQGVKADTFTFRAKVTVAGGYDRDIVVTKDGATAATLNSGNDYTAEITGVTDGTQIAIVGVAPTEGYEITEISTTSDQGREYVKTDLNNTGTMASADATGKITNDRTGTIPTGLFINYGPYMAVALAAVIAAIVFIRRRKSDEFEEDL